MADDPNAHAVHPGSGDGWRATLLAHRPVVNVRLGQEIGHVADIIFDPEARRVSGLLLEPSGREHAIAELARRTFGGTFGLIYVGLEHVLALNADVVTADLDATTPSSDRTRVSQTRLGAVLGFAVVTIRGHKLGQLADLLLDHAGRHILAYLVESGAGASSGKSGAPQRGGSPTARSVLPARPHGLERPQPSTANIANTANTASTAPAAKPGQAPSLTVPASREVRFGRDLIIVAGTPGAGAPDGGTPGSGARHTPAKPDAATPGGEVPPTPTPPHEPVDAAPEQPQP